MKSFDISLYGNIILDNVYYVSNYKKGTSNKIEKKYTAVGSIGNMLEVFDANKKIQIVSTVSDDTQGQNIVGLLLQRVNSNVSVDINVIGGEITSNAVIISDLSQNIRTSMVEWGICTKLEGVGNLDASWVHIMYLDTLEKLNAVDLKELPKDTIISADLCLGKHTVQQKQKIMEMAKYIDYLILSDVEAKSLTSDQQNGVWRDYCMEEAAYIIGKKVKKLVIIHSPYGSVSCNNEGKIKVYSSEFISTKKLNVLGAGDLFASSFIKKMIDTNDHDSSIKYAHKNTTNILKKRVL
jgi:sugar/nucleoside kinase (ribokinase family)